MIASASTTTDRIHGVAEVARPPLPRARTLAWSVRRELWEHRWILIGPLPAAFILIATSAIGAIFAPERISELLALGAERRHDLIARPYVLTSGMVAMGVFFASVVYCLEALQSERRDRSILFWKSLPVSDTTVVLSKACIPLVVLPLLVFVVSLGVQGARLLMSSLALLATGGHPMALWSELRLLDMPIVTLYGVVVMTVMYAPIYGWLLMVSAWARRLAALWALLIPYGIVAGERMVFGHSRLLEFIWDGLILGAYTRAFGLDVKGTSPRPVIDRVAQLDPIAFLGQPGIWIGLALTAAFLFIAIRLRSDREPT